MRIIDYCCCGNIAVVGRVTGLFSVRESKNSICRFFYQMFAGYHDIAYILIIACRGSVSGQIEYLLNDVAWHRRVFELSDAPSAADYIVDTHPAGGSFYSPR